MHGRASVRKTGWNGVVYLALAGYNLFRTLKPALPTEKPKKFLGVLRCTAFHINSTFRTPIPLVPWEHVILRPRTSARPISAETGGSGGKMRGASNLDLGHVIVPRACCVIWVNSGMEENHLYT